MSKKLKLILLFLLATFGCAGFKGNYLKNIEDESIKFNATTKTKVYYKNKLIINESMEISQKNFQIIEANNKKKFIEQLNKTNCCEIVNDESMADVKISGYDIPYPQHPYVKIGPSITGAFLGIIPFWSTIGETYKADIITKNGNKKSYEYNDEATLVIWLPMILFFPFANPFTIELEKNLYNNLILNIKEDGFLSPDKS